MLERMRARPLWAVVLTVVPIAGWSVQPASEQNADGELGEVVVTARKTAERIQDIPLMISSYDAQELAARGLSGLEDIAQRTPGFVFQEYTSGFDASPTIRGLTQFDVTSPVANVATVINGVYVPRNYSVDLGIADISRIDIVKGPQSALYGGNAFAGVIAYTLGQPTVQPQAEFSVTGGIHGRFDYQGAVGGSIWDGVAQGRAFYARSQYHGSWANEFPHPGQPLQNVGGHDNQTYGVAVKFQPVSRVQADFNYFRLDRHEDVKPGYSVGGSDGQVRFNCDDGTFICGTLDRNPVAYQSATSTRPGGVLEPTQPGFTSATDFVAAQLKATVLTGLDITYLFGHVRSFATEITTPTDNPVSGINLSYAALLSGSIAFGPYTNDQKEGGSNRLNSHELRLDYTLNGFKFLLGGYLSSDVDNYQFNIWQVLNGQSVSGAPGDPFDFTEFPFALQGHHLVTDTTAEFGSVGYGFLDDKASVSAEVRHSSDRLRYTDTTADLLQQNTFNTTTPRFTASYKLTAHDLLYASAARGVKEGGFNGVTGASGLFTLLPSQQTFQPESNWTYELGSKSAFLSGRLVLNADVFYVKWNDLQIQEQPSNTPATLAGVTSVITTNLGSATSKGIESDGLFAATSHLDVNYAVAWLDPKFDAGVRSQRFHGLCDGVTCPVDTSVGGHTLPRTSKVQASGGVIYKDTLWQRYQWNAHAEFTYQSSQQVEEMNLAQIPARFLVNTSVGLTAASWDVTMWAKNVFNRRYLADSYFVLAQGAATYAVSYGELATLGVTFKVHF